MGKRNNKKAFRYSGNKAAYIQYYPAPPIDTKRIVELFCGSASYAMYYGYPWIGYEVNSDLVELWEWLITEATEEEIRSLDEYNGKFDIRDLKLSKAKEVYYRVNVTGLMTGQLSSYEYYPQHSLPKENTCSVLSTCKQGHIEYRSFDSYEYQTGDFVFVDPPYLGTSANYIDKSKLTSFDQSLNLDSLENILQKIPNDKFIFTYKEQLWDMNWTLAARRKCPTFYGGSGKWREEWFATRFNNR